MAFIPLVECWRVSIDYTSLGGNNAANVIHVYDELGDMSGARANEVCDIVRNWLSTEWADQASDQWTAQTVNSIDAGTQTGAFGTNGSPTTGTLTSNPLPSQDTVAVSLYTGLAGRSNRGRLYHVGLVEDSIVDGLLAPTPATNLINCYLALRTLLIADSFAWVVASFYTNGAPRTAGVSRSISDISFRDNKIDRQIRRKK